VDEAPGENPGAEIGVLVLQLELVEDLLGIGNEALDPLDA
jgi:hypothetical protein